MTAAGKAKFYGRMLFDLQVWTVYRDLRRILPRFQGNVLDVGCGQSPYRFLLDQRATRYVGIDIPEADRKFDYDNSDSIPFDGTHIPFPDDHFEAVICTEVLEHVESYQELVDEIYRVMTPGAVAIITVPWSARYHYIPHDYFRFTPSSLGTMFSRFRDVRISPRGTDIAVIASKLVALWVRNLIPKDKRKRTLAPLWVLGSPFVGIFLVLAHSSTRIGAASSDDPLGYTIVVTK